MSSDKTTLKTEAGGTFKRLPSFKPPRDLKLSQFSSGIGDSRTKKVFVPNLNVQRKKQNDSQEGSAESNSNERKDRNKRDDRLRQKKSFIQGQGVFSEGLAPQMKRFMAGSRFNQDQTTSIPKPKLKLNEPIKVDQNEEDLIMKELMRDDFLDDPSLQPDLDYSPVQLPLQKFEDLKVKETKEEIPRLKPVENLQVNGVRIKQEVEMPRPEVYPEEKPVDLSELRSLTAAEILHNQAQDSNFIFFQIPNSIPRLKVPEMKTKQPQKDMEEEFKSGCFDLSDTFYLGILVTPNNGIFWAVVEADPCWTIGKIRLMSQSPIICCDNDLKLLNDNEGNERCSLRSLPPGQIGTLQILKSGRARLLLGDVKLQIESGTQVAFKQELVSVDLNSSEKNGNIIHIGNLTTRILVTPDWETLINNSKST